MNLVGDFGGGGMMLAFGMLAALIGVQRTGKGQMVDAAMTEGSALLSAMQWGMHQRGLWADERGVNLFDTGAPFYDTYACADGAFIAVGALEPQFYALLLEKTGLSGDPLFASQMDRSAWPAMRERLTQVFASRTRAEWCALMEGSDACFAPVLSLADAPSHPHNAAREAFIAVGGVTQPAPAPRLSATPAPQPSPPRRNGEDSDAVLSGLGYSPERVGALRAAGIIG
jgi:alpha-methylacyl-CoA racemase